MIRRRFKIVLPLVLIFLFLLVLILVFLSALIWKVSEVDYLDTTQYENKVYIELTDPVYDVKESDELTLQTDYSSDSLCPKNFIYIYSKQDTKCEKNSDCHHDGKCIRQCAFINSSHKYEFSICECKQHYSGFNCEEDHQFFDEEKEIINSKNQEVN